MRKRPDAAQAQNGEVSAFARYRRRQRRSGSLIVALGVGLIAAGLTLSMIWL